MSDGDRLHVVERAPDLAEPGLDAPLLLGKPGIDERDTFVTVDDEGVDSSGNLVDAREDRSMAERYRFPRGVLAWVG